METHNYRNRLDQLQEKIRKSELERLKLEKKFENLMRDRNDSGKAAIRDLRNKYNHFLDDDRKRTERNDNLLRTLERVDYQAGTLAAKSERLRMLKGQYELYLMRRWSPSRSILMVPNTPLKESSVSTQTNINENFMPPSTATTAGDRVDTNYKDFKSDFVKYLSRVNRLSSTTPIPTIITNSNTYEPTNDYKSDMFDRNGNYNVKQTTQYGDMYHMDDQFNAPLGLSQPPTVPMSTTDGNLRDNDAQLHQPLANTNNRQLERGAQLNTPYNPISTESYFSSTYSSARPSSLMGNKQWMERPQTSTIKANNIDKPMHTNEQIINSNFITPCTSSPNIVISSPIVYKDKDYPVIANNHNQPRMGSTSQPLQIDTNTTIAPTDVNARNFVDSMNKFPADLIRKNSEINPVYGVETNIRNIDVDIPQKVGAPYGRPQYPVLELKQNILQPTDNINSNINYTSKSDKNSNYFGETPSYAVITNVHNIDVNLPQQAVDGQKQQYTVVQTQQNSSPSNNGLYTKPGLPIYQPTIGTQQKTVNSNVNQNEINNPDVIQVPYSTLAQPIGDKKLVTEPRILNSNHMVENIHQIWEKVVEVSPSISPPTPPDEKQTESQYKEQRTSQILEKDEDYNNSETVDSTARASIVQSDIDKNAVNYSPYNETHNAHQHKIVPYPKNLDEVQYEVIIQNNLIKRNSIDTQYANRIINNDDNELTPVESEIVLLDNNKVNYDVSQPSANIEKIEEVYYGEKIFYPTNDAAANAAKHIDINRPNATDKFDDAGSNSVLNENFITDKQWQQQQQSSDARNASITRNELMLDNTSNAYKQDTNADHEAGNQGNMYYIENQSIIKNNEQTTNENKLKEIKETNLIKITQKEVKQVEYVSEKYKPDIKMEQPLVGNNENYKDDIDGKGDIELEHGNVDAIGNTSEKYDETKLYEQQYDANQEQTLNVVQEPLKDYSQEYGIENIQQEYAEVEPAILNQNEQNYANKPYQDNQNYYDQDYQGTQIYDNQDGQVYPGNVEDFAQGELTYQQPEYQEYQEQQPQGEAVYAEQTEYTEQPLEAMQQSDQQNPNYAEYYQPGDQTQMYEQDQYTNHVADNQQQEYVQYSNDAYYTQEPGENYYNDVQPQQQDQEFHQTALSENSDLKSDVDNSHPQQVSEVTNNIAVAQVIADNLLQASGEDSSTYSDNTMNVPQQLVSGFDTSDGLPTIPVTNRPIKSNPQESESDEKSLPTVGATTIVKNSTNDESDFDFSSSK